MHWRQVESAIMSLVGEETTLTSDSPERGSFHQKGGESAKLEGTFGFRKFPQNLNYTSSNVQQDLLGLTWMYH